MKTSNKSSHQDNGLLSVTSSKGNQEKWSINKKFYKLDYLGYEGLAECVCSDLLEISNCKKFVKYKSGEFGYKGNEKKRGCVSDYILSDNEKLITLYRLFQNFDIDLKKELKGLSLKKQMLKVCDLTTDISKLDTFTDWLMLLLKFDYLVLNEDRHYNNIALIYNIETKKYSLPPIFDNGASLLSDTETYSLYDTNMQNIKKVKSKPFSTNFEKQFLKSCEISDSCIQIDYNKTENLFSKIDSNYKEYTLLERERVKIVLRKRLNMNRELFQLNEISVHPFE